MKKFEYFLIILTINFKFIQYKFKHIREIFRLQNNTQTNILRVKKVIHQNVNKPIKKKINFWGTKKSL